MKAEVGGGGWPDFTNLRYPSWQLELFNKLKVKLQERGQL